MGISLWLRNLPRVRAPKALDQGEEPPASRTVEGRGTDKSSATLIAMALKEVRGWLTNIGVLAARPAAFVVFLVYAALWMVFGKGLEWHSLATLATWGMTLVIQRAEHRDTQAIHAKLDELLKVHGDAKNSLMNIDDKDAEEVERERAEVRASCEPRSKQLGRV
ncbi:low affinity iron permease family protein [Bradyrhizobium sp. B117]|uniref:low affinity iron permease family protein n=1 Tax=Bradyrhizobium sp. B117 TaxID=3140246 RepID=UPI003183C1E9